ncbi:MAG: hypothetical protein N4A50_14060 [Vallitalea sp.]|jgi:hypothetical protein|nr:hypothetical protein [Vallitalea sp.]
MKKFLSLILTIVLSLSFTNISSHAKENGIPQTIIVVNEQGEEVELKLVKTYTVKAVNKEEKLHLTRELGGNEYYSVFKGSAGWVDYAHPYRTAAAYTGSLTLSISDSISWQYNITGGVTTDIFTATLGITYGKTTTVTQSLTVDTEDKYTKIYAFPEYKKYSYEIWEDDAFYDDYIGDASYDKVTGVEFGVYQ